MSLAKAIVQKYYPELMAGVNTALPLEQRFLDDALWLSLAPQTETPDTPVMLLVRDPIDRFLSAMAMMPHLNVDDTILELRQYGPLAKDPHFARQSDFSASKFYQFPDQIEQLCNDAGLPCPLPVINEGVNEKPQLSDSQRRALEGYYAADIKLFSSVNR